jgi:hypothetical protein
LRSPRRSLTSSPRLRLQANGGPTVRSRIFSTSLRYSRPRVLCRGAESQGSTSILHPLRRRTTYRWDICSSTRRKARHVSHPVGAQILAITLGPRKKNRRGKASAIRTISATEDASISMRTEFDPPFYRDLRRLVVASSEHQYHSAPTNITNYLGESNPDLWLGDYRILRAPVPYCAHQHHKLLGRSKPRPLAGRLPTGVLCGRGKP